MSDYISQTITVSQHKGGGGSRNSCILKHRSRAEEEQLAPGAPPSSPRAVLLGINRPLRNTRTRALHRAPRPVRPPHPHPPSRPQRSAAGRTCPVCTGGHAPAFPFDLPPSPNRPPTATSTADHVLHVHAPQISGTSPAVGLPRPPDLVDHFWYTNFWAPDRPPPPPSSLLTHPCPPRPPTPRTELRPPPHLKYLQTCKNNQRNGRKVQNWKVSEMGRWAWVSPTSKCPPSPQGQPWGYSQWEISFFPTMVTLVLGRGGGGGGMHWKGVLA